MESRNLDAAGTTSLVRTGNNALACMRYNDKVLAHRIYCVWFYFEVGVLASHCTAGLAAFLGDEAVPTRADMWQEGLSKGAKSMRTISEVAVRSAADCGTSGGGARRNGEAESRPSYVPSRSVTRANPTSLPTTTSTWLRPE